MLKEIQWYLAFFDLLTETSYFYHVLIVQGERKK